MSSAEYDVEAEIKLDSTAAKGATAQLTNDLLELQRTLLNTGSVMLSVFKGVRPQLDMFSTSILGAAGHMENLRTATSQAREEILPLGRGLESSAGSAIKLGQQGRATGNTLVSAFGRAERAAAPLAGVFRSLLGLGAAYLSVRAIGGAFASAARASFAFGSEVDKNRTSLGAVLAATHADLKGIEDRNKAMMLGGQIGDAVFRTLQQDALKSVATSQEMATIFTQITGPLANAGASLKDIRQITNDSVSAATVLGVDYAQAARDLNLMATGVAGQDTALFRMLKATGRITEETKEWNEMLPEKRLARMKEALQGFAPAAAAFEKTLPGITSSFVDYAQRFRQVFMAGPLEQVRLLMVRLVDVFRNNETRISSVLQVLGQRFAGLIGPIASTFSAIANYFLNNWEAIGRRIESTWQRLSALVQNYGPTLMAGAKTAGTAALVSKLAPGAVGALSSGVSAGLAGGAAVEGSAFASAISGITHLISVVSAMGGLITYVVPIIAVMVGLVAVLADQWQATSVILGVIWGFLQQVFSSVYGLIASVFGALMPLLKIVGAVVAAVLTLGLILGMFVTRILWGLFLGPLISGFTMLFEYIGKAFDWVYEHIVGLFTGLAKIFGAINADLLPKTGGGSGSIFDDLKNSFSKAMAGFEAQKLQDETVLGNADKSSGTKAQVHNDFRGSKIEVKQDFRQADPDRVWAQFVEGINDAAGQRLSSSLIPEFTR